MPHFSNTNGLHFHLKNPFDLQSINSCISFLKYNVISNYVQRQIMYSHHSCFHNVWKSLLHYWKTGLEWATSLTKRVTHRRSRSFRTFSKPWLSIGLFCQFSTRFQKKTLGGNFMNFQEDISDRIRSLHTLLFLCCWEIE